MNDKVKVTLISGKGGDGAIAFRHEFSIDHGGPYGGNGGKGGSVFIVADHSTDTLTNFRFGKTFRAADGEDGRSKLQFGKDAKNILLHVPVGTVIEDEKGHILADLCHEQDTYMAVKGGRGGRGNAVFKSSVHRTPDIAENGMPGQNKDFYFELKLLGDVGLVGFPNVGKSTFLAACTRANPKVADYPFTTLEPMVGVCYYQPDKSFVIADIPGLIEGASSGKGLGFTFLRHIERCRVLLHVIDVTRDSDPFEDFSTINKELANYKEDLLKRPMVVVLNKIDEEYDKEKIERFKDKLKGKYLVYEISAKNSTNLRSLIRKLYELVVKEKGKGDFSFYGVDKEEKVYGIKDSDHSAIPQFEIVPQEDGSYNIVGDRVVRTKRLINLTTDEGIDKLTDYLDKIGVEDKLKAMGVKDGSTINLDGFEFEYYD
jgi:GTP-binding protein